MSLNPDGIPPPHDLTAEASVLSALMIDPKRVGSVSFLEKEHFYSDAHAWIYQAIREIAPKLDETGKPCIVLVGSWLNDNKKLNHVGGMSYITEMLNVAPFVANVVPYARIVQEKWRLRKAGALGARIHAESYFAIESPQDWLESAREEFAKLGYSGGTSRVSRNLDGVKEAINIIKSGMSGKGAITGLPTGIKCLDELLNGLHGTQLTLIAARPAQGKSALLQQIVLNVAKRGIGAMLFSYEMSKGEISMRHISCETRIDSMKMAKGEIEMWQWEKIVASAEPISKLPILVMDDPGVEVNQLESMVMTHINEVTKQPIGLIAFDYVQIIPTNGKFGSREQEVGKISRTLKRIAMSTKLPVLAAAQVNRENTKGQKPRAPKISDLRESGSLEQDSNNIIFLHSDDPGKQEMDLIVAKQRGGKTGTLRVMFEKEFTRFYDPEDDQNNDPYTDGARPY